MTDNQIKHLEFIQNIITRMNSNSFQIKGWMITIVSALLALFASSEKGKVLYIFVAIAPTLIFWFLDSFYLQQERKYRRLYDDVIKPQQSEGSQDNTTEFSLNAEGYKDGECSFCCCFTSTTILPLYGSICLLLFIGGCLILKYGLPFNCS